MSATDFGGLTDLINKVQQLALNPETANQAAELAAAMLSVLGSGPSIAAIDSTLAANQANGILYYNAQENQQIANIIGMVTTMNCVQQLLNGPH
jgi:hypothetical protein